MDNTQTELDQDLLPPGISNAEALMSPVILAFYKEIQTKYPGAYVNGRERRYNRECGFRTGSSTVGAKNSMHKLGRAIDIHRPAQAQWTLDQLRAWISNNGPSWGITRMEKKEFTPSWVHIDNKETDSKHIIEFSA